MMQSFRAFALLILLTPPASAADADDWHQFLGPRRDGIARVAGLNIDSALSAKAFVIE